MSSVTKKLATADTVTDEALVECFAEVLNIAEDLEAKPAGWRKPGKEMPFASYLCNPPAWFELNGL